jgi:hypothetical protein
MNNMKGYKSHGVKNFKYVEESRRLIGIYNFLARPKISNINSVEDANALIISFCKHELDFHGGLRRCAKRVHENWDDFTRAVKMNKE